MITKIFIKMLPNFFSYYKLAILDDIISWIVGYNNLPIIFHVNWKNLIVRIVI